MASGGMGRCPVVALGTPAERGLKASPLASIASRILILHHPLKVLFLHPPRTPFLQSAHDHYPPSSPNFFPPDPGIHFLHLSQIPSHHSLVSPRQSMQPLSSLGQPVPPLKSLGQLYHPLCPYPHSHLPWQEQEGDCGLAALAIAPHQGDGDGVVGPSFQHVTGCYCHLVDSHDKLQ